MMKIKTNRNYKTENDNKELLELIDTLIKFDTRRQMYDFLHGILTPKELLEIPKRLAIVKMLKKGVGHQQIADKLHVGVATVTRGSREIQKGRFAHI
ncbi:MAG TPA: Trp family transcriptional regulator [Xanthomonadales bacterium]|nr:Trp family transcriptional regulator [Xanthomonadales bacterium]